MSSREKGRHRPRHRTHARKPSGAITPGFSVWPRPAKEKGDQADQRPASSETAAAPRA